MLKGFLASCLQSLSAFSVSRNFSIKLSMQFLNIDEQLINNSSNQKVKLFWLYTRKILESIYFLINNMNRTMCDSWVWFKCLGAYFCKNDYDMHYNRKSNHSDDKQINSRINDDEKILLKQKLIERIATLQKVKKYNIQNLIID